MNGVIIAAVLLGVCQFAGFVGLGWFLRIYFEAKQREVEERLNAELSKLVAGEPCQSGAVLNAIGQTVGREAGRSAKAALMADLSHAQRAVNDGAVEAQVDAISGAQPALGGLLAGMSSKTKKGLLNNPLVGLAVQALTSGRQGANAPDNGAGRSVRDRLKNQ